MLHWFFCLISQIIEKYIVLCIENNNRWSKQVLVFYIHSTFFNDHDPSSSSPPPQKKNRINIYKMLIVLLFWSVFVLFIDLFNDDSLLIYILWQEAAEKLHDRGSERSDIILCELNVCTLYRRRVKQPHDVKPYDICCDIFDNCLHKQDIYSQRMA